MRALLYEKRPLRWVLCKAAGTLAPRIYWSRLSSLRYAEIPEPQLPAPDWVRLRTRLGGICGTDLATVTQRIHPATIIRPFLSFPIVLGHENVAVIDQVGAEAAGWQPGTRVVVEPSLSCQPRGIEPMCASCRSGCFSLCDAFAGDGRLPAGTMIGLNAFTSGSWAPLFVAHHSQLHAIPDDVSDAEAVLIDPIACGIHAVLRHRPLATDRVLVQGGGIMGMGVVMALRALDCGCEIIALARHPHQADRLRQLGADLVILQPSGASRAELFGNVAEVLGAAHAVSIFGNRTLVGGADVVYDCVGTGGSLSDAMKFSRSRGTVVEVGTSHITLVDTTALWFNELTIVGAYGRQIEHESGRRIHTYDLVCDLLRAGRLSLAGLLTHTFAVTDYKRAFSTLMGRGRWKVIKAAFDHSLSGGS